METDQQIELGKVLKTIKTYQDNLVKIRNIALKGHAHPEMTDIEVLANEALSWRIYEPPNSSASEIKGRN